MKFTFRRITHPGQLWRTVRSQARISAVAVGAFLALAGWEWVRGRTVDAALALCFAAFHLLAVGMLRRRMMRLRSQSHSVDLFAKP